MSTHDGANGEMIPSLDLAEPTNSSSKQDWNDSRLYKLPFWKRQIQNNAIYSETNLVLQLFVAIYGHASNDNFTTTFCAHFKVATLEMTAIYGITL